MQDLGGDVAAAQPSAQTEQPAQARVLAAQLGKERGREHRGIALRDDAVVAVAGGRQQLGLPLQKEKRGEDALS